MPGGSRESTARLVTFRPLPAGRTVVQLSGVTLSPDAMTLEIEVRSDEPVRPARPSRGWAHLADEARQQLDVWERARAQRPLEHHRHERVAARADAPEQTGV